MILSDVSIKRPVFATMMNVVIIVFGLFSLPQIGIEQYPNIDFPVVSVLVPWPGADPKSVQDQVLEPLERAVNGIAGLDKIRSTAYPNAGMIVLQFVLERDSNRAAQDVRDKIASAIGELPQDAEAPIIQKLEIGGAPIINLVMSAKDMGIGDLSRLAQDDVRARIQRIDGVARVELAGDRKREIHVLVSRNNLSSYGLTPNDVLNSIKAQNLDVPSGKIENGEHSWSLRVDKKAKNINDIAMLPVLGTRDIRARIADIAEVKDTIAEETTAAFIDQQPTILLSVYKQSGGNTSQIADNIRTSIAKMNSELPAGVELSIVTDNSKYIKGSIDAVKLDLMLGAFLAVIVVLIFLRDLRATLISAIALPTAVIGTFAFLRYMGFTLNMMTMLGLSLSIGILIDDAIVVIENIYRHLSMGKNPIDAAKDATSEIGLAVLATSLTICAVFVPVAFMDGIIGRFFFQFGLTVAFAVLISLFVAFTLAPMLSSRWLKAGTHADSGRIHDVLTAIDGFYKKILAWCLQHRKLTLLMGAGCFVLSLGLLAFIPVSFFPREDRSNFVVNFTLPENTNIEVTKAKTLEIVGLLKTYPGVTDIVSSIGSGSDKKPNAARLSVNLVDVDERQYAQQEIMARVRQDLLPLISGPGAEFDVGEDAGHGGGGKSQNLQIVLMGPNREDINAFATSMVGFLKTSVTGAVDVITTKPKDREEYNVDIRLDLAKDVGLMPSEMALGTRTLFEGQKVGQFEDGTGRYDIRVRAMASDRTKIEDISSVTFNTAKGQQLSLGTVASIHSTLAPSKIERYAGQEQITVLANYTGKDLNGVTQQIKDFAKGNQPKNVTMIFEGEAEIMAKSIASMLTALMLAVLLIYMILCAQYERYLAPFVIMMALPLSLTGAFGALLLTGQFISVYTMIGIILLMGLVTKNGILLIDFTLHLMSQGKSVYEALMEAGPVRLRPILMTTFAAGFGMLPVAIGHGDGGEAKAPMGVAVMGGLFVSTLLTLVVVPCLFSLMEDFRARYLVKAKSKG